MLQIILMGVSSGDWLPFLGFLFAVGALIKMVEFGIAFLVRFREKRRMRMEQEMFDDSAEHSPNDI